MITRHIKLKTLTLPGSLINKHESSHQYLRPVQGSLDQQIDQRLVRTFYDLFITILVFRNRAMGLLLSELGGYICGFDRVPAGTKRISNLLRSKKWTAGLIDQFLFDRTKKWIEQLQQAGKRPLLLWDDSRIESWRAGLFKACVVYGVAKASG